MKFDYFNSRKKDALLRDVRALLADVQKGEIDKKQAGETLAYVLKVDDTNIIGKFSDNSEFTVSYLAIKKVGAKRATLLKEIIENYSVSKDPVTETNIENTFTEVDRSIVDTLFPVATTDTEIVSSETDYREDVEVVGHVDDSDSIVVDAEFKEIE